MGFANKVGKFYPYLHLLLLSGCIYWYFTVAAESDAGALILYSLLAYAAIILIFGWMGRRKLISSQNLFFALSLFDAAIISILTRYTGGHYSDFYLAYFPAVALASVICLNWRTYIGAIWYGLTYIFAVLPIEMTPLHLQTLGLRLVSIWSVGVLTYAVAQSMRASEQRLLNTLDTLNERTWELESSQLQLSNIYETTRALSGILVLENLLPGILDVAQRIFRFQKCQVYLSNAAADCLYLYASLENGNRRLFEKPTLYVKDISPMMQVDDRTALVGQINRTNRQRDLNYIDIPLVSRGKIMGIMRVVGEKGTPPPERERHLLMIFANSAAVAIDNSLLHKKTEDLTIIDELTELFNFRYFRNKLTDELRRADRYRQRFSLLMMDLDLFKSINDVYGHQTGNIVLREVSGIIKQCIRDVDIVARYGGEEFAAILPQTGDQDALVIAERIRSAVEKAYFSNVHGQRDIQITISIGVASYPDGVHTIDQLLDRADKALYAAKANGRNQIVMAPGDKRTESKITL